MPLIVEDTVFDNMELEDDPVQIIQENGDVIFIQLDRNDKKVQYFSWWVTDPEGYEYDGCSGHVFNRNAISTYVVAVTEWLEYIKKWGKECQE